MSVGVDQEAFPTLSPTQIVVLSDRSEAQDVGRGDVLFRHGSMKRVAAAVGEGASAIRSVHAAIAPAVFGPSS
jgi:hypothetical protein